MGKLEKKSKSPKKGYDKKVELVFENTTEELKNLTYGEGHSEEFFKGLEKEVTRLASRIKKHGEDFGIGVDAKVCFKLIPFRR